MLYWMFRKHNNRFKVCPIIYRCDETRKIQFSNRKMIKKRIYKCCSQLSCSVWSEIHKDNTITRFNAAGWVKLYRHYKFISNFVVILFLQSRLPCLWDAFFLPSEYSITFFSSIPMLVPIHCIESAMQRTN